MGIGARRGRRHGARRALVACACLAVLAGCADSGASPEGDGGATGTGSPGTSTAADGTPSGGATVPAVDTEHAVEPPPKLTDSTLPADMLIFSQQALSDDVVDAIKALDGVAAVERLGMGTALVENRAITVASVDPATYRRFTLAAVAQQQDVWDRVAGGEMAMPTRLGKRLGDKNAFVKLGNDKDAPEVHIGAYAPQVPSIDAVVNEKWGEELDVPQDNALIISTLKTSPQSVRPKVAKLLDAGHLDPAARRGDPLRPRPGRPADRHPHRWLGRAGGRLVLLPGDRRRPDRPRQRLGAGQHPHRAGADPGQRDLPQGDAAAAAGRAHRGAEERPRRQDPPGGVRRVLLPALHRRARPR